MCRNYVRVRGEGVGAFGDGAGTMSGHVESML